MVIFGWMEEQRIIESAHLGGSCIMTIECVC